VESGLGGPAVLTETENNTQLTRLDRVKAGKSPLDDEDGNGYGQQFAESGKQIGRFFGRFIRSTLPSLLFISRKGVADFLQERC
jgi:hypothetical protein